ncbi:hypothetical protein [Limosilactobacillus kribbianus]|uniref:hypothetical protein n=1 Tax=Limosilactobacillus kribbianus TaxID=2982695 RepID=UPI002264A12D|nr:hypothetical protein [Limosilactobacillus kribbianus]
MTKCQRLKLILKNNYACILIVLTAGGLLLSQTITNHPIVGADSVFHYNRFYETYSQLRKNNFSWFQSIYSFNQSGRIVNAVYGPLFAYLNGLLLFVVHSWAQYQLLASLIIYLIAGYGMYRLVRRFELSQLIAALTASVYLTIGWVSRWQTGNNATALGAMLAPYLLQVLFWIVTDSQHPIHWKSLALLMSITIEVHLLSAILFMLLLVPAWLYGLKIAVAKRQVLVQTGKAVGVTLILTANTLGPLIFLSLTNHLVMPADFDVIKNTLRLDPFSNTRTSITIFFLSILLCQLLFAAVTWRKNRLNLVVTVTGFIFLWGSSHFFPWTRLVKIFPSISRYLQFPVRLTILTYPLLMLGMAFSFGLIMNQRGPKLACRFGGTVLVLLWLICLGQAGRVINHRAQVGFMPRVLESKTTSVGKDNSAKDRQEVLQATRASDYRQFLKELQKRIPDYLASKRANTSAMVAAESYANSVVDRVSNVQIRAVSGGRLKLTWSTTKKGTKQLPVVTYRYSKLIVNGHQVNHFTRSLIGSPTVKQQKGRNVAYLVYVPPTWLNGLIAVSLLAWLLWAGEILRDWIRPRCKIGKRPQ